MILQRNLPVDTVLDQKCDEFFGVREDRKSYQKELKTAVRQHGYDTVVDSFDAWASTNPSVGRKPISAYIRSLNKAPFVSPVVSSPVLQTVEQSIALASRNKVFFHTQQKLVLAVLVKKYGEDTILEAFKEFFAGVSDDDIRWAAKNFIEQAETRVLALAARKERDRENAALLQQSLIAAELEAEAALEAEEEEIEECL